MSKQRPRSMIINGRIHTHHTHEYLDWLSAAESEFKQQWGSNPPIKKAIKVSIQLWGNHAGSDVDNMSGSALDALVKAGVLSKDNVNCVPHLEVAWERSKSPCVEVWIDY